MKGQQIIADSFTIHEYKVNVVLSEVISCAYRESAVFNREV